MRRLTSQHAQWEGALVSRTRLQSRSMRTHVCHVHRTKAHRSAPDVTLHVEYDARAEAVQLHRQFLHAIQALAHSALMLGRTDDEQEAAATGAGQLGAGRTGVERPGDRPDFYQVSARISIVR